MKITAVIPVYNEKDTLRPLLNDIIDATAGHSLRVLFIDDGSSDGSTEVLRALHAEFDCADVLIFRRNCGKTAALAVGFSQCASGTDVVFTLDADLQDDPKEMPRFLETLQGGADLVVGWKKLRHDPWHKTFPSRVFNFGVSRLFGLAIHDVNCGFKAMRPEVAKKLRLGGDLHRLIPVLAHRMGYKVMEIPVEHHARRFGVSKYGMGRFMKGIRDVLRVYAGWETAEHPENEILERLTHGDRAA